MKIQTYSVLVGSRACDARCPYCVSKMTPAQGVGLKTPEVNPVLGGVNWRNFKVGCRFAQDCGVSTVLLTGKGEPILFPGQITEFLRHLHDYRFPFIELQTNGIRLFQRKREYERYLKTWYKQGLTTVAVSIVHYENEKNGKIFQPNGCYMDLVGLIGHLHSIGFSVRLTTMMYGGGIDCVEEVKRLIEFAKKNRVEQLTIRPIAMPEVSENPEVANWVAGHTVERDALFKIRSWLNGNGTELMRLVHGAIVYDVRGQNICLSNCLTISSSSEEVRQLIFFPDGHLRYDWQYPGAILL